MVDIKRSRLPPPAALSEAPNNLQAPAIAPIGAGDGRSIRATGRTQQLATRVTESFYDEIKLYAAARKLKLVEVLELGFEALKEREP
jgi:hypothetical protein